MVEVNPAIKARTRSVGAEGFRASLVVSLTVRAVYGFWVSGGLGLGDSSGLEGS